MQELAPRVPAMTRARESTREMARQVRAGARARNLAAGSRSVLPSLFRLVSD